MSGKVRQVADSNGSNGHTPQPAVSSPQDAREASLLTVLSREAPKVLKHLDQQDKRRLEQVAVSLYSESRSGPIPSPEDMRQYGEVIPNGADRIMRMAEQQAEHRRSLEAHVIAKQQEQSGRGQLFALLIAFAGMGAATVCAIYGREIVGSILAGSTLVALTTAFLRGKRAMQRDLADKS